MRLTRKWFAVINPLMALALRSPLHFLFSDNIMLLTFTGRSSGRAYTTPVRYIRGNGAIRCFTSQRTRWWRNMIGGASVTLHVGGETKNCKAEAVFNDPKGIQPALDAYLRRFPQDAVYHNVRLNADRTPNAADLALAARTAVLIRVELS